MSKINWAKALAEYISDETLSYQDIASKYGISKRSVVNRAKKDNWQILKKETLLKVHQKLPEKTSTNLVELAEHHASIGNRLINIGLNSLENEDSLPRTAKETINYIVNGIDLQRKAFGMDNKANIITQFQINFGSKEIEEWAV